MFFKLAFKTLKQRKSIGCTPRKSSEYFVMVESANLPRTCLGDYRTQSHLAIASKRDLGATPCREYGGTVKYWH